MQSPYAHVAPSHRVEAGGEGAYILLRRGRKHLHELDRCAIETRIAWERLLLESHLAICRGAYGQRPTVHRISRQRHAARSRRRYTTELLRMSQGCQSWRGGYAAGYKTQKDLRPTASGKAQPREEPLEVEVVQLQQSQPTTLAV
jgi:hypothetical protein